MSAEINVILDLANSIVQSAKNFFDKIIVAHPVTSSQFSCYKQSVMSKIKESINKTNSCLTKQIAM